MRGPECRGDYFFLAMRGARAVERLDVLSGAPSGSLLGVGFAPQGQVLFESDARGCTQCHQGPQLTDSSWLSPGVPLLHDVGTLTAASGQRLGEPLIGLDTPSLHGLWNTAPYLHDGRAATLEEVLIGENPGDAHGVTSSLASDELEQLIAFLLALEGS